MNEQDKKAELILKCERFRHEPDKIIAGVLRWFEKTNDSPSKVLAQVRQTSIKITIEETQYRLESRQ